jgi:capsular polysaccharide biosynthesis protein
MISIERVLQTLLRRVSVIILVTVVVTGSALGFSLTQTPTYEASIKILVGQKLTEDADFGTDVSDLQELTVTVAQAVQTLPVAQAVVEQPNVPELSAGEVLENMSVEPSPGSNFINVSYESSDPEEAQLIANTIGQALSQKISEVSVGVNGLTATVWAPATLPETPVSPDLALNGIVALVLGGLLGIALAFLLEYLDDSWESPEEVEEISGLPAFGVIPAFEPRRTSAKANK